MRHFLVQRDRFALVGQRVAEQVAQVLQHQLGARRVVAHQRDRGIERVEQEVRADAGLQLRQAGRRLGRHPALGPQHQRRHQRGRQQAAGGGRGDPGHGGARGDQRAQPARRPGRPGRRARCRRRAAARPAGGPARACRLQAASSHSTVAGSAAALASAAWSSQSFQPADANIAPTATSASTQSTARSTTPTWQASNTGAGSGRVAARRLASAARSVKADKIWESFIGWSATRLLVSSTASPRRRNLPGPRPAPYVATRTQVPGLVGPFQRAHERPGQALHRQRRLRQAPVAGRHPGLAGARRHARRAGNHLRARTWPPSSAGWRRSRRTSKPAGSTGSWIWRTCT